MNKKNIKQDFLHKLTYKLPRENQVSTINSQIPKFFYTNGFSKFRYWTQQEAIELCIKLEKVCINNNLGVHVALTGGLLYKQGYRKDLDLIFYRIRQIPYIDMIKFWNTLYCIGIVQISGYGWCFKAQYQGKSIDCLFPDDGEVKKTGYQYNE